MKHFGMEFKETEKGFTIEFSGDEATIKARKEAIAAWHEFVVKARKAGLPLFPSHHGMHRPGPQQGECCKPDQQDNK